MTSRIKTLSFSPKIWCKGSQSFRITKKNCRKEGWKCVFYGHDQTTDEMCRTNGLKNRIKCSVTLGLEKLLFCLTHSFKQKIGLNNQKSKKQDHVVNSHGLEMGFISKF